MIPPRKRDSVTIATISGPELGELTIVNEGVQLNVYTPRNGGAGLFVVFDTLEPCDEALEAVRGLLSGEPLAENIDLTARVPGALAAGSMPRPKFSVGNVPLSAP